jgi:hypothetical protein
MAVEPQAAASSAETWANSLGPPPIPPSASGTVRPSKPDEPSAEIASAGNLPSASTSAACSAAMARTGCSVL